MKQIIIFSLVIISVVLIGTFGYLSYSDFEEHEHNDEHSVEIEGSELKDLTVQQIADLWEIDSEIFLSRIITEFSLKENYNTNTILELMREEYAFSPALIKDMAEELKQGNLKNE
jgi:hypothetical protein